MVQLQLPDPKASKREKLLALLLTGKRLSKQEILREVGAWNSGDLVLKLRRAGYDVKTEMVTQGDNTFARYFMDLKTNSG